MWWHKTGYALMAAGSAAKLTVSGGDIEAIQSIGGAQVNISGGSVYCEGCIMPCITEAAILRFPVVTFIVRQERIFM